MTTKKFLRLTALFLLSATLTSCSGTKKNTSGTADNSVTETSEDRPLSAAYLTTEEKVGQILMVRCDSASPDYMLSFAPGGIVMFAVDFDGLSAEQVTNKILGYKNASEIEPYIAVDEEGGTVVRVSSNPQLAPSQYKSPQYYYHNGGMAALIENTKEKSELLTSLGITMNLAPVADVSTDPQDFIYDRALGTDAETTALYIENVVNTMNECKIASCLKHFPGYGSNVDTHTGIAIDNRSADSFRANDFIPFEYGIAAGADSVLVSHNIITVIDPIYPASISKSVHDILRNELNFDGIILTDDMSMQAIADYEKPYTKAVLAGNDMIIVSDYDDAYNEILSSVKSGEIPTDILNAAVDRVLESKRGNGLLRR